MVDMPFLAPGGFSPTYYYKLDVHQGMEIKLFGDVVRAGQDAYKMAKLLDRKRFKSIPKGWVLDTVLRSRAKGLWFKVDYDHFHGCFFVDANWKVPELEAHPAASQKDANDEGWWPSHHRALHRQIGLEHVLDQYKEGTIWTKKETREEPKMVTPDEVRLFTDLVGFESISALFLNPKDLMHFCRTVSRDDQWEARFCHLDYRSICDENDIPISYTDFRVPRGTLLGQGFRGKKDRMNTCFAATIQAPNGVEQM
jgi:hypothetical protein